MAASHLPPPAPTHEPRAEVAPSSVRRDAQRSAASLSRQATRRRRRERGAALVEAAVTIPFFVTIFLALAFVGSLYTEKFKTVKLSRQAAWTYAMKNCKGSQPDVSNEFDSSVPQNKNGMDTSPTGQFEGAPGGNTISKGFNMARSTMKGKVTAKTEKATWTQDVQTTTWVTCNEEPIDGDMKGMLSFAWTLFTGW